MKNTLQLIVWVAFLMVLGEDFLLMHWETGLILFAALVLAPKALALLEEPVHLLLLAGSAVMLGLGYWLGPGKGVWASAPYAALALIVTGQRLVQMMSSRDFRLLNMVRAAALLWWCVAALSAVSYLAGYSPFGFPAEVINLTAAHFHLAGLVFTSLLFCLLKQKPSLLTRAFGWASLLGMPAVAVGIIGTQLGFSPRLESVCATSFALMALAVAVLQLRLAIHAGSPAPARFFWGAAAGSLFIGAALALLYALRFQWSLAAINIPNMKLWHGTLNTLGFGWLGLEGWMRYFRKDQTS